MGCPATPAWPQKHCHLHLIRRVLTTILTLTGSKSVTPVQNKSSGKPRQTTTKPTGVEPQNQLWLTTRPLQRSGMCLEIEVSRLSKHILAYLDVWDLTWDLGGIAAWREMAISMLLMMAKFVLVPVGRWEGYWG